MGPVAATASEVRLASARGRNPRAVRLALLALVLGWTGFVVLLVVGGPGLHPLRDLGLYTALLIGAAALTAARARSTRRAREAWAVLGLGIALLALGDLLGSTLAADRPQHGALAPVDVLYLGFYLCAYVAAGLMIRDQLRETPLSVWLDGVISSLALGAALVFVVQRTALGNGGQPQPVALAYPLADTILLALVVFGLVLIGETGRSVLWWFAGALVLLAVADLLYVARAVSGGYVQGTWIDALWPAAAIGLAVSAWRTPPEGPRRRAPVLAFLAAPVAGLLVATGVLVLAASTPGHGPPVAMAGAAICVVTLRFASTVAETARLADARRLAATDELTGLPNRDGFAAAAAAALHDSPEARCTLLVVDLDAFKEVNDSLGHAAGDRLLAAVARQLEEVRRSPRDVLGRLGGDEFALLLPDTDRWGAEQVARRVHGALTAPVTVDGLAVQVAASIGIAGAPQDGTDLSTLLRRADLALNRAKAAPVGHVGYDEALDGEGEHRLQRIAELRRAIDREELVVHYQPKIALSSAEAVSVEALVRWDRPGRGLVPPDDFLPLVESSGLMPALTAHVLDKAIAFGVRQRVAGTILPVAVNVPSGLVLDAGLPRTIREVLARHGAPASMLTVEITEEALLHDGARARAVLAALRSTGVRVSIDDYGSGYSSLSYLRELIVDEVKLDKSFVLPMADDPSAAAIVRSTIDLAHALGLQIVAEGVEDARIAELLTDYGCDTAQGYLWTRPLPADGLRRWLEGHDTVAR